MWSLESREWRMDLGARGDCPAQECEAEAQPWHPSRMLAAERNGEGIASVDGVGSSTERSRGAFTL